MKRLMKIVVLLAFILTVCIGCSNNENVLDSDGKNENQVLTYTVSVKNDKLESITDVDISIYSDESLNELIATGTTNSDGVAAFTLNEYIIRKQNSGSMLGLPPQHTCAGDYSTYTPDYVRTAG